MTENLNYNDYGLVIGLISYSFRKDGKELFKEVFEEDLFLHHRKNLKRFTYEEVDQFLYQPKGYRLFGNHGIAVLSLIDDYAFCNRIFNDNHTHITTTKYKWGAKIITGVGDEETDYLYKKAQQTFLRQTSRYPFIGIMKLKIDHRLLYGKGIAYTRLIKKAIFTCLPASTEDIILDHVVVDCFDNDEMSVIAFSNSLHSIHEFMEKIRKLKHCTIVENFVSNDEKQQFCYLGKNEKGKDIPYDKHVFTSCYINLGYDVEYNNKERHSNSRLFLKVSEQALTDTDQELIFICEAKPGHSIELEHRIMRCFSKLKIYSNPINRSITGGSILHIPLPVSRIDAIEAMCLKEFINDHIRRVKISLRLKNDQSSEISNITEPHEHSRSNEPVFDKDFIDEMKKQLNKCGVSKIVRERLLSLYRLYNESAGNLLHSAYFNELEDVLRSELSILGDFLKNDTRSIKDMDDELSKHIAAFEEACYNRFHEKGLSHSNNLEYNGSVQQYLTCFDFLYKQLFQILVPPQNRNTPSSPAVFVSITGHERVSSTRRNLQLNINQITYPEFFATTVWKEIANHLKPILEYLPLPANSEQTESYKRAVIWRDFISSDTSYKKIRFFLAQKSHTSYNDEIYQIVHERLDREFLEDYLITDQIVFHFGFQRNYALFWHFYWKTFLQTSTIYSRKGEIDRKLFIDMLLRLIVVRISDYNHVSTENKGKKKAYDTLIREQKKPYDSIMADLWLSCYDKVCDCAESIYQTIDNYGFSAVSEDQICAMEHGLACLVPALKTRIEDIKERIKDGAAYKINRQLIEWRDGFISSLQSYFAQFQFELATIQEELEYTHPDYAICLLNAFLKEVMIIDLHGKKDPIIRSVPRDNNGKKRFFIKDPMILASMVNMPADPLGGVLITDFSTRKKYFSIRTAFYRRIWHYKMILEKLPKRKGDTV